MNAEDFELGSAVAHVCADMAGLPHEPLYECDPADLEAVGAALRPTLERLAAASQRLFDAARDEGV